ncbi:Fc.00g042110.m01.CDS01 [Cosmosporella sp. VM-42]
MAMAGYKLLIYLFRRDLRASDNPILHHLATSPDHGFTHLLPIFVLPPHQIEISGFLAEGQTSPYPQALSRVGKFWRCGPHRAKFLAQSAWDLKKTLEASNSGLVLRVGSFADVLKHIVESLKDSQQSVDAVWMTEEHSDEEIQEQNAVSSVCSEYGIDFNLWPDEKYLIDHRDTGLKQPLDLPDVFTTFRKTQEPLRQRPRPSLPSPATLPPQPASIPPQNSPFVMPNSYEELEDLLLQPLQNILPSPPVYPRDAKSAHPFEGGEGKAWDRVRHLVKSGAMTNYKDSRNGLVGLDFSTKLSAYLALGCITARQVHEELVKLEDGKEPAYQQAKGYNQGENEGTKAVRFELLWRDYMRLCTMKFGSKLFKLYGSRQGKKNEKQWKSTDESTAATDQDPSPAGIKTILDRFLEGRTGMGLIDASQRELYLTGYTSNRARQNVASFLSKHLEIDWRYGAEWYEMMLIDYDVSSNWSNWQYVAGVGNDPRGDARIFNPVKQAFDYDNDGIYVRTWVPEVKHLEKLENVFQAWTTNEDDLEKYGLSDDIMVTDPVKKIKFTVDRKPRGPRRPYRWRRGGGRGPRRSGWSGGKGGGSSTGSAEHTESAGAQDSGNNPTGDQGQQQRQHQPQPQPQLRHEYDTPPASTGPAFRGPMSGHGGYGNMSQANSNGYSMNYSNEYPNGFPNGFAESASRGGWGLRGRGNSWRGGGRGGSGRGSGNASTFRRGYSYQQQPAYHQPPPPREYGPPPPFPPPQQFGHTV